ncbi:MAG TPA: LON peptidase substrate-binding domain-containing protein [Thermoguttaceae bacterium]|nr:LON peptidase substrate-binding domain-containing protein [Thermoguttaceae bacterium]
MSTFEDYRLTPAEFSGIVRLLPIPNLVLFPHMMQPLRVTEPRYRDLLEDALHSDRFIALATPEPGWEPDYHARPPLRPYACLGRIAVSRVLDDGTYGLLLMGLRRVRLLKELPPRTSYREATVVICEDLYSPNQIEQRRELRQRLCDRLVQLLPRLSRVREPLDQLLSSSVSLGVLTDVLSYTLDLPLTDRQTLLSEVQVHRRAELLLGCLAATGEVIGYSGSAALGFPSDFSKN